MIVIDMDMPKNCSECYESHIIDCDLIFSGCANCGRHPNCPIKCDIEDIRAEIEHEGAMFLDGEFFVSIDRINEIIDKYREE